MSSPAYHLRPNKAVERFLFIDALRCLDQRAELEGYTYYGFGGAYLEDFRLIHESFPKMKMVSFEENLEIYKRQKFHQPNVEIEIFHQALSNFLTSYDPHETKSIFWLDYTGLKFDHIEEFMDVLQRTPLGSVVKITLAMEPGLYHKKEKSDDFMKMFYKVWPSSYTRTPPDKQGFSNLLQEMIQIAAEKSLPSITGAVFQPISSFYYKDGATIFTLTGVKCSKKERKEIRGRFSKWNFSNLHWAKPKRIDVPILSTKERLHLQRHLPCEKYAGRKLKKILGYKIEDDLKTTYEQMKQYSEFYIQYPYFIKAMP